MIIVETNDAILVTKKDQSQRIKKIVNELKANNIPQGQKHKKIYRPWGNYESIIEEPRWQVKLIKVKPGETLSFTDASSPVRTLDSGRWHCEN